MKKQDLKTGMLVETRLGERSLVMLNTRNGDILGGSGVDAGQLWSPLNCYDESLCYLSDRGGDIVKVYDMGSNYNSASLDHRDRYLLWERVEPTPLELAYEELLKTGFDNPLICSIIESAIDSEKKR
jgi:hypothetical protein